MDPVKNFAKGTLLYDISDTATELKLSDSDAARFPDPATDGAFNVVIWDENSHPDPADDPNVEIVRVTASSGSGGETTWTITRAQEGTSASSHSAGHKIMEGPTAKTITDLENTFLKLDQTTAQTISDGTPLLNETPTGTADIKSLVNKEYVDLVITSLGAAYYMYDEDDATGYKTCYLDPSSSSETYIEKSSLSDDDYIGGWISASGEAPNKLLKGVYNWYITAEKTGGTKTLKVYWKLYERKSDSTEVLVATSSNSNEINGKATYLVPLQLDDDYIPDSGSRIVGKLYADVSGGGSSPTIRVYYQGNTSSRWEIPANSEIFKDIFVPYSGATQDVDMNTHKISNLGDPTSDQDAATKKYVDDNAGGGGAFTIDGTNDIVKEDVSGDGDYSTDDFVFGSPSLDYDSDTNHAKRFFFDKSKGAFRAGYCSNTNWDDSNRGSYSFAVGYGTKASGICSFAVGDNSTASDYNSHVEGYFSIANADYSYARGNYATASGNYSHAEGLHVTASGNYSYAGGRYSKAYLYGQYSSASGYFSTYGDAQYSRIVLRADTTDATQETMYMDNNSSYKPVLPASTTWGFVAYITARSDGGVSSFWKIEGAIKRDGSNNTALVGSIVKTLIAQDSGASSWDVDCSADDTNESLAIKVTGAASTNIRWVCTLHLVEVGY